MSCYQEYNKLFCEQLKKFNSLIRKFSKRYSIPGVLLEDDLYQEGLCALFKLILKCNEEDLLDEYLFTNKLCKYLRNRYSTIIRNLSRIQRDYKSTVSYTVEEHGETSERYYLFSLDKISFDYFNSFCSGADLLYKAEWIDKILKVIEENLYISVSTKVAECAISILRLLRDNDFDLRDFRTRTLIKEGRGSNLNGISCEMLATRFGWNTNTVERAVSALRAETKHVSKLLGYA